jgi:hypothetical protein
MKINELLSDFQIFTTREEHELLNSLETLSHFESFSPREQFVIENLIRKSLVSKVVHNNSIMVIKNA